MSRRTVCGLIALSVAAAVAGFAAPAGESQPLIVRALGAASALAGLYMIAA